MLAERDPAKWVLSKHLVDGWIDRIRWMGGWMRGWMDGL